MEESMEKSEVIHNITQDVYQRVVDLGPQLREFTSFAKQYHKALLGASVAANIFYQGFAKIAHLASETKGSNKMLGKAICDIIAVHKQIESQTNNVLKAFAQDFIVPLENWIENSIVQTKARQKTYIQESKNSLELVEKSKSELTKVRKKSQRSKTSEKYDGKEKQILAAFEQHQGKLDHLRVSGCHEAMNAQRNVFSFIIEKMLCVSKMDLAHHEKASSLLIARLPVWDHLTKQPLSLDVNVISLVKQLTECKKFDKSLDEYLSSSGYSVDMHKAPSPPPIDPDRIRNKRFSQQLSVTPITNGHLKDKERENRGKVRAIYRHHAADSTQLSFDNGDVIKALTTVTSGWQYGENTRTMKSGWFPIAFTEKFTGSVAFSVSPTHSLPALVPVHSRPSVLPESHDYPSNSDSPDGLVIPERDYGIPQAELNGRVNNNYVVLKRNDSQSSGIQSLNNSASSLESSTHEKDAIFMPPPPPPPPPPPILEEDTPNGFPPPPPPPMPPVSGSFDQAL
ncbi:brain-specific angiogenesis inhibitor 1-associated protein 2-like [Xenia sp. Carnegie-2017]|uniref:brain-specific angiogenesis inhibitor 1-associated protein 2-like n=1 Tax=Xenia sp. Carnegie-2017 TaxID=2897299 RepID=UPI001F0337A1|nr:brain-specific angiogenesis inhibitor 1-associated protein 2-like [Xenia sp. Carnegie-2017]